MSIDVKTFSISGLKLITMKSYADNRGYFVERFNERTMADLGFTQKFVQDNFSQSKYGVLRGLHYQTNPAQGKLVGCFQGSIFDVAVDIRQGSATYGQHIGFELSDRLAQWLWIPAGFAHGFQVTSQEGATVMYKVDAFYNPKSEYSIAWNDPALKISWPLDNPILSEKDRSAPLIASL